MENERRVLEGPIEVRFAEGETVTTTIRGYAARFNSPSAPIGGRFVERIAPGAFDEVLANDVRALINHDPSLILGRSLAGTLRLSVDERGLAYEVDLPDVSYARDLATSIERGDISQSSFSFSIDVDGEEWSRGETGMKVRTLIKVKRLYDVSPVTYPAYPEATIGMRSLDRVEAEEARAAAAIDAQARRRQLRLLRA